MNRIRRNPTFQALVLILLMPTFAWLPMASYANPADGKVIAGSAEILQGNGVTRINQFSDRAIIEWQSFSIDSGEITKFLQPGSGAVALNRVTGMDPSTINGLLQANGSVYLINPNGILIGPSGVVDVAGFLASTLDVSNADFMAGGDMLFTGTSTAEVMNLGKINAAGGDVIFMGHRVSNKGVIGAVDGTVAMAGGSDVLVSAAGDRKVFVSAGSGSSVNNEGEITGSMVELRAHGNAYALAVQNSGVIRAKGADVKNGRVFLSANEGDVANTGLIEARNGDGSGGEVGLATGYGEIHISNMIDASAWAGEGGKVSVLADAISMNGGEINVDGDKGGSVNIGNGGTSEINVIGSKISANGSSSDGGNISLAGGDVVIYGDSTLGAVGEINGGGITITGSNMANVDGSLDASGISGAGGKVLISSGQADVGGSISADGGAEGGLVVVSAAQTSIAGSLSADGGSAAGGTIAATGSALEIGSGATITADGADGGMVQLRASNSAVVDGNVTANGGNDGGNVVVDAANSTTIGGSLSALGEAGKGGDVSVTGTQVALGDVSVIDVSGGEGGIISVGGGFQGNNPFLRKEEPVFTGNINIMSLGTITMEASTGYDLFDVSLYNNFYQLGKWLGDSSTSQNSYVMVGHGGMELNDQEGPKANGDISVTAAEDLIMLGGTVERDAYAQIGHGGLSSEVDSTGMIDVTVGNDLIMRRGTVRDGTYGSFANATPPFPLTQGFTAPVPTPVAGTEYALANGNDPNDEFGFMNLAGSTFEIGNAYAKIGHGQQRYVTGQRDNDHRASSSPLNTGLSRATSTQSWSGDINVSVGRDANLGAALIGHLDSVTPNTNSGNFTTSGTTTIAVARADLQNGGQFIVDNFIDPFLTAGQTVFSSGEDGFFITGLNNNQLRIYAPTRDSVVNMTGIAINGSNFTPAPVGTILPDDDEQDGIAEFVYGYGVDGEPVQDFTPEGFYPPANGISAPFYQVFYASFDGSAIPGLPQPPVTPPTSPGPSIDVQPEIVLPPPPPEVRFSNFIELNATAIDSFDDNEEQLAESNELNMFDVTRMGTGVQSRTTKDQGFNNNPSSNTGSASAPAVNTGEEEEEQEGE